MKIIANQFYENAIRHHLLVICDAFPLGDTFSLGVVIWTWITSISRRIRKLQNAITSATMRYIIPPTWSTISVLNFSFPAESDLLVMILIIIYFISKYSLNQNTSNTTTAQTIQTKFIMLTTRKQVLLPVLSAM